MNWVISGTCGPTDPTRAMLPFTFAASAVQAGDSVTLMLFHDAVLMAVDGVGKTFIPVGPPNRYEEIASNAKVTLWPASRASKRAGSSADSVSDSPFSSDFTLSDFGTPASAVFGAPVTV